MSRGRVSMVGLGLSLVCAITDRASGADWPQWRGKDRSGVSTEVGLATSWPSGGPKLLWRIEGLGKGFSGVAIVDGRLYTMGTKGDRETVVAYDLGTQKRIWASGSGTTYKNGYGDGPRSTPTIDGDLVYTLGARGDLSCLRKSDGKAAWRVNILDKFDAKNIRWGISESPLIEGDLLIVSPGGDKATVVAFHKKTGKVRWTTRRLSDKTGYASAVPITVGGVRQTIHFTHKGVVGVRTKDGAVLWRNGSAANRTANCATPIVSGNHVFVSSGYGTGSALLELLPSGSGKTKAKELYFTKDMQNHHGNVVLISGYLYGYSSKSLNCLELETGELKWRNRGVGKGTLMAAGGYLYFLSEDGKVALIEATPGQYREISTFDLPMKEGPAWTCPLVLDGKLYIRCLDELFCYDVRETS